MEELNSESEHTVEALKEFTSWVENFCLENGIVSYHDSDKYIDILNFSEEKIMSLSSEECFCHAVTLMNYAGNLQKKVDIIESQYYWCNQAMNYLYAKYWSTQEQFIPAEIKKQSIILENSYAQSVEKNRIRLHASLVSLKDTCKDIKRRVAIFQDLGKYRSFK